MTNSDYGFNVRLKTRKGENCLFVKEGIDYKKDKKGCFEFFNFFCMRMKGRAE